MTQLDVVAQQTPVDYKTPINGAISLATALSQTAPLAGIAANYAMGQMQTAGEAEAKKAALVANGAKYKDAVAAGTIQPTSNPFYMQAYERESSAISATKDLNAAQLDSTTWPEKNDPTAFANRWNQTVSTLGKNYSSPDEDAGFTAAANQVTQQTLSANQAENVQRITTERKDNLSQLAGDSLVQAYKATGGQLTGPQASSALAATHLRWTATGGTEPDWQKMVVQAAITAGYATNDADLPKRLLQDPALMGSPQPVPASDGAPPQAVPSPSQEVAAPPAPPPLAQALATPFHSGDAKNAAVNLFGVDPAHVFTDRTEAQNKASDGVPDSMHLTGQAVDFPLPPGMTPDQVKAQWIAAGNPLTEFLYEGAGHANSTAPHIHIGWRPKGGQAGDPLAGQQTAQAASLTGNDSSPAPSGPNLYDQAGVAEQVETASYRIASSASDVAKNKLANIQDLQKIEGQKAQAYLYQKYGTAILTGNFDVPSMLKDLNGQGFSPQGIASAMSDIHTSVSDTQGLMEAKHKLFSDDPSNAKGLFDLDLQGRREGWSPQYEAAVGQHVLAGDITSQDGASFVGHAIDRSKEDAKDVSGAGGVVRNYAELRNHSEVLAQALQYKMTQTYGDIPDETSFQGYRAQISNAGGAYLVGHPGDYQGAYQAMAGEAARNLAALRQSRIQPRNPSLQTQAGGNPRRPAGQ